MQKIQHTYIVQYYGTERSDTCVRIFMEFMEGVSDSVISTVLNIDQTIDKGNTEI